MCNGFSSIFEFILREYVIGYSNISQFTFKATVSLTSVYAYVYTGGYQLKHDCRCMFSLPCIFKNYNAIETFANIFSNSDWQQKYQITYATLHRKITISVNRHLIRGKLHIENWTIRCLGEQIMTSKNWYFAPLSVKTWLVTWSV